MNTFADRLNFLLANAEMRPIDLANATGIDKSSISRYLNGDYIPKQRRLTKIARALNADEGWLLTGVDQKRNIDSFELSRKDEREIESDLEDMMNSISSAAYEGEDDIEDLEAFKATIKAAMIQAKKIAKKKYTPKKYRKDK
ncbi:MAG: helix-turn-helix domain-containing protein [Dialister sp.]|nr:helix-turn-helix domain-containing protein [Dialister sp.]MDU5889669.1 helix-turn-helix domain-containing protein [Dialister sp.]